MEKVGTAYLRLEIDVDSAFAYGTLVQEVQHIRHPVHLILAEDPFMAFFKEGTWDYLAKMLGPHVIELNVCQAAARAKDLSYLKYFDAVETLYLSKGQFPAYDNPLYVGDALRVLRALPVTSCASPLRSLTLPPLTFPEKPTHEASLTQLETCLAYDFLGLRVLSTVGPLMISGLRLTQLDFSDSWEDPDRAKANFMSVLSANPKLQHLYYAATLKYDKPRNAIPKLHLPWVVWTGLRLCPELRTKYFGSGEGCLVRVTRELQRVMPLLLAHVAPHYFVLGDKCVAHRIPNELYMRIKLILGINVRWEYPIGYVPGYQ